MPHSASDAPLVIEHVHPRLRVDETALRHLVRHILEAEDCTLDELTVILADRETVLDLNRTYLDHNYPTDVLSFPFGEQRNPVAGEIYVDLDTAKERHHEFEASFDEEVQRYVAHGLLHLIGYRDGTPNEQTAIRALENRYLAAVS